jgi:hypothetical protein
MVRNISLPFPLELSSFVKVMTSNAFVKLYYGTPSSYQMTFAFSKTVSRFVDKTCLGMYAEGGTILYK